MAGWSYLLCSLDHECRPFDDFANWTLPLIGTNHLPNSSITNNSTNKNLTNADTKLTVTDDEQSNLPS